MTTIAAVAVCVLLTLVAAADGSGGPRRGWSIPLVDLSERADLQTVVDREPGQYLGHPTTVLLEDGVTVIVVYPKGHGRGAIQMQRSHDGGRSWSGRLPTPENWATSLETPTIHRVVDRLGRRRLILFSGLYPCRLSSSDDDGQTWSPLAPVGEWGGIVTMASVERVHNGDYLAFFHDDGRYLRSGGASDGVFRLLASRSSDGGLTWSRPWQIQSSSAVHLCEPGLVRSPDGREIAMLLRENSRRKNSHIIFSRDEGATWTEPQELPGALTGDRHTAKYLQDGRLFISFRDMALEGATHGDWVAWIGRYSDLRAGREGLCRVRLMRNHDGTDCAYPGVEVLSDGTILTVTYGHWRAGEQPWIAAVRVRPGEIDAELERQARR